MGGTKLAGHIASSQGFEHNTPQWVVDCARECFGGQIDLDPASNEGSFVKAKIEYRLPQNGLELSWHPFDTTRVFVNMPFGTVWANKDFSRVMGAKEHSELAKMAKTDPEVENVLSHFTNRSSVKDWYKKAQLEHKTYGAEIIMISPVAVCTSAWQDIIFKSFTGVCFPKKRVAFLVDGEVMKSPPMETAIVYAGSHYQHFSDAFSKHGRCINLDT